MRSGQMRADIVEMVSNCVDQSRAVFIESLLISAETAMIGLSGNAGAVVLCFLPRRGRLFSIIGSGVLTAA